jgi:hypothetical protein
MGMRMRMAVVRRQNTAQKRFDILRGEIWEVMRSMMV